MRRMHANGVVLLGCVLGAFLSEHGLAQAQAAGGSVRGSSISAQRQPPLCAERSCYPATGNLLVGREEKLTASSTCGLNAVRTINDGRYCIVSHLQDEKCSFCDSRAGAHEGLSHNISNIVPNFSNKRLSKWWQAENGIEQVQIQINFDAEFHFTHLIITFKTFRPKAMLIERSYDFGRTWHVYRYFAHNCRRSFPRVPMGPIRNLTDVICEERYSDVTPSSEGEVIFKVLPQSVDIEHPYAPVVQDLLKMTNLRINFTELHTLGDDLLDKYQRSTKNEKYYYAIHDMVVRGSCSCYGHASRCIPTNDNEAVKPDMVYGTCECSHNTRGLNCDHCEDFYNDLPWRPAWGVQTNACKKCQCHGHATKCHFDPAVYAASNFTSGGVCENCEHNTDGRNCQDCKNFFYKDSLLDINDPHVCKPCDCDPIGTKGKGECERHDDPASRLVAGHCPCKKHVSGKRCDSCADGFWNMELDNPDGCQPCQCSRLGTIDSTGCDKETGTCECKRFVTGPNCELCLPGYWGLSSSEEGCKPCNCKAGGSVNDFCDQATGQCTCHPNIIGRQCDQASPGYFVADFGYLVYEAEYAKGTGNARIVYREPALGVPITWTGPGFMRVFEEDSLEFTVDNIPTSMSYDIVIRYETQMPKSWNDVRVTVIRDSQPDPYGPCANSIPQEDYMDAFLSADIDARHHIVTPATCLETRKSYIIRIELTQYNPKFDTPGATILLDSIVLMGAPESTFMGELVDCRKYELEVRDNQLVPEKCKDNAFVMGTSIHNQAFPCDCDVTGSVSTICEQLGGQCKCKQNVIGRQCDQCAPGTYGFGPQGCVPCNCNGRGARDNFCDTITGQCMCVSSVNGRVCDRCQNGYYGFPNCRACQCNGHADECEDSNGRCKNCRDLTAGAKCDQCLSGYYGDPRTGSLYPCRACQCPGGAGSDYQHTNECVLDLRTLDVRCLCPSGYDGSRCEVCSENYYGNPVQGDGACRQCSCNGNIDKAMPGSCNKTSGACIKCLFNTEGDQCQTCISGHYGDATRQNCQKCVCNMLGSVRKSSSVEACDRATGQCVCQPNVVGRSCDECAPDHWKLASGDGCETCDCDASGSISAQCNEFDGQCNCIPGRGGRRCDECEPLHWGNPNIECQACGCNPDGSSSLQCDFATGQCPCLPGVTGTTCDRCDRGTSGVLPNCMLCGDCFDDWDSIISGLKVTTADLIVQANQTKNGGGVTIYEREFTAADIRLSEAHAILETFNDTNSDMNSLKDLLNATRSSLAEALSSLLQIDVSVSDKSTEIAQTGGHVSMLQALVGEIVLRAEIALEEVDKLVQADIHGAYINIVEKAEKSQDAISLGITSQDAVSSSAAVRQETERFLSEREGEFLRLTAENEQGLADLESDLNSVADDVKYNINKQVCDRRSINAIDSCDAACGGGGCETCGAGQSCSDGARGKAAAARNLAEKGSEELDSKSRMATDTIDDLQSALENATLVAASVATSHVSAEVVSNKAESARAAVALLLNTVTNFLQLKKASPVEIEAVVSEVLSKSIPLSADQINELAQEINETITSLTDIDAILNATSDDLLKAAELKRRADGASKAAGSIRKVVQQIVERLKEAGNAQARSREVINKAITDVGEARHDLASIETLAKSAQTALQGSLSESKTVADKSIALRKKAVENEANLVKAQKESKAAFDKATEAQQKSLNLAQKHRAVSTHVESRYNATEDGRIRAARLFDSATKLAAYVQLKRGQLAKMATDVELKEQQRDGLSKQVETLLDRMASYTDSLIAAERVHKTCLYTGQRRL